MVPLAQKFSALPSQHNPSDMSMLTSSVMQPTTNTAFNQTRNCGNELSMASRYDLTSRSYNNLTGIAATGQGSHGGMAMMVGR